MSLKEYKLKTLADKIVEQAAKIAKAVKKEEKVEKKVTSHKKK